MEQRSEKPIETKSNTTFHGMLIRLFWLLAGPLFLAFIGFRTILADTPSILLWTLYIAVSVALIVARYIDIRFLGGFTEEGEPATLAHWKAFTNKVILFSGGGVLVILLIREWFY